MSEVERMEERLAKLDRLARPPAEWTAHGSNAEAVYGDKAAERRKVGDQGGPPLLAAGASLGNPSLPFRMRHVNVPCKSTARQALYAQVVMKDNIWGFGQPDQTLPVTQ
eukprot:CAMPEP_0178442652 /NCGR_PEP_ID=MMETSP0689_2-20121128/38324_1 /TAXON_ID=160604 /ORGANISM="Amphidinium massartii, Strain CS-259" /LENGTH=108 /DNA_ID=CAMNT_0020066303 /DNA_START=90 /DNA_END=416 /DNA_ORIENTATION=-